LSCTLPFGAVAIRGEGAAPSVSAAPKCNAVCDSLETWASQIESDTNGTLDTSPNGVPPKLSRNLSDWGYRIWRRGRDSNPPLNVGLTTYRATDGTLRRFKHCKTVVMAGERQVNSSLDRPHTPRSLTLSDLKQTVLNFTVFRPVRCGCAF